MLTRKTFLKYFALSVLVILGWGSSIDKAATNKPELSRSLVVSVSVKDPPFLAKGNGMDDDTMAIQAAINYVDANGGGTVFFPAGTYLICRAAPEKNWCLLLRSNIDYVGVGPASKLVMAPIRSTVEAFIWMMATDFGVDVEFSKNITIRRLHFDGNKKNQDCTKPDPREGHEGEIIPCEQLHAILLNQVEDCRVEECLIHDTLGDAVFIAARPDGVSSQRVWVTNNEMHSLDRVGVNFQGASNSTARNNYIHDTDNNAMKMEEEPKEERPVIIFSHNRFIGNTVRNSGGMSFNSSQNVEISDILIEDNTFDETIGPAVGLAEVKKIKVIGNIIRQPSDTGITVRSSVDIMIKGNTIRDGVGTQTPSAAILVHSDSSDGCLDPSEQVIIENNVIRDNLMTACTLRRSIGGVIKDNLILNNIGDPCRFGQGVGSGIDLQASSDTLVSGNIIKGNNGAGILIRCVTGCGSLPNTCFSSNNSFRSNKIISNGSSLTGGAGGIWVQSDAGSGYDFGTSTDPGSNCIQGNAFLGLLNETTDTVKAIGNFWGCLEGPRLDCDPNNPGNPGCGKVCGLMMEDFSNPLPECPIAADDFQPVDIVCLKDDRTGDVLRVNLTTGAYKYTRCHSSFDLFFFPPEERFGCVYNFGNPFRLNCDQLMGTFRISSECGVHCCTYTLTEYTPTGKPIVTATITRCFFFPDVVTVTGNARTLFSRRFGVGFSIQDNKDESICCCR